MLFKHQIMCAADALWRFCGRRFCALPATKLWTLVWFSPREAVNAIMKDGTSILPVFLISSKDLFLISIFQSASLMEKNTVFCGSWDYHWLGLCSREWFWSRFGSLYCHGSEDCSEESAAPWTFKKCMCVQVFLILSCCFYTAYWSCVWERLFLFGMRVNIWRFPTSAWFFWVLSWKFGLTFFFSWL